MSSDHKTTAGINWKKDPIFIPVKIAVGNIANSYHKQYGYTNGWLSEPNQRKVALQVTDQFRYLEKEFKSRSTHQYTLGAALVHRGRRCWPTNVKGGLDELRTLLLPQFKNTTDLATQKIVGLDDVWNAQEKWMRMKTEGLLGVYIQDDPLVVERGYVGGFDCSRARSGHLNSPFRFVRFLATQTEDDARKLELSIHRQLSDMPNVTKPKGNDTQGQYFCEQGFLNAVSAAYKPYFAFYNTLIGWK
jgi:hypothetical protein